MAHQEGGGGGTRQPPVHIPLDFEKAVEGLIGVKPTPKEKAEPTKKAQPKRKKSAKKK